MISQRQALWLALALLVALVVLVSVMAAHASTPGSDFPPSPTTPMFRQTGSWGTGIARCCS